MNPGLTIFEYRTLIVLAGAACFYTTKFFLSPIYVIYPIVLLLGTAVFLGRRRQAMTPDVMALLAIAFMAISHAVISRIDQNEGAVNGANANLIFGIAVYLIIRLHWRCFSVADLKAISGWMIWPSVVAVLFSAVYRYLYSGGIDAEAMEVYQWEGTEFYTYKLSDPLFLDSNTTGMVALIMLSYIQFLNRNKFELPYVRWAVVLFIVGLLSTYSRAAIFAGIIIVFLYLYDRFKGLILVATLYLAGFVALAASAFIFSINYAVGDLSFQQKIDTFFLIEEYLRGNPSLVELLFGLGPGKSVEVIGIFTHNVFVTYLTELGVFGLLIFLIFLVSVREAWVIVLPCIVAALSYFMYLGSPFFYLPIALGIVISESKKLGDGGR